MGSPLINHPFWGTPIDGKPHVVNKMIWTLCDNEQPDMLFLLYFGPIMKWWFWRFCCDNSPGFFPLAHLWLWQSHSADSQKWTGDDGDDWSKMRSQQTVLAIWQPHGNQKSIWLESINLLVIPKSAPWPLRHLWLWLPGAFSREQVAAHHDGAVLETTMNHPKKGAWKKKIMSEVPMFSDSALVFIWVAHGVWVICFLWTSNAWFQHWVKADLIYYTSLTIYI